MTNMNYNSKNNQTYKTIRSHVQMFTNLQHIIQMKYQRIRSESTDCMHISEPRTMLHFSGQNFDYIQSLNLK